jgi:hypothetical protein
MLGVIGHSHNNKYYIINVNLYGITLLYDIYCAMQYNNEAVD